jgi:hypothetical protein
MQVGPTSDFSAHMYSIYFLNILYHYMCTTRAHVSMREMFRCNP